jgi:hypothetical protein
MKNEVTRLKYPLDLQMFAEPTELPTDPPSDPPSDPQDPPKTFTQEELDRIVAERIARERKKTEKFADYDDVKAKLGELQQAEAEREKAKLSETERLEAEKAAAIQAAEDAKAERDKALKAANKRLIKAEFKTLAREMHVRQDALDDAYKLADLVNVNVDEDGNVAGVEDVVKALIESKPYLVEKPSAQPKAIGGASGKTDDDERRTLEQQLADARKVKDFSKVIEISNKLKTN